jgi:hypothetical protein
MFKKVRSHARSNAIAYTALFLALGGGAYAAATVAPANSVNSAAIINRQVKATDLANGAVNASKVASNSLGGGQINESSLGTVPRASLATNAGKLGGSPASAFTRAITFNGQLLGPSQTKLLSTHGLTLTATCTPASKPATLTIAAKSASAARFEINAIHSVDTSAPTLIQSNYVLGAGGSGTQVLLDEFQNTVPNQIDAGGTFVYTPDSGHGAVTGTFHYYFQNGGGECDFLGNAVPSP